VGKSARPGPTQRQRSREQQQAPIARHNKPPAHPPPPLRESQDALALLQACRQCPQPPTDVATAPAQPLRRQRRQLLFGTGSSTTRRWRLRAQQFCSTARGRRHTTMRAIGPRALLGNGTPAPSAGQAAMSRRAGSRGSAGAPPSASRRRRFGGGVTSCKHTPPAPTLATTYSANSQPSEPGFPLRSEGGRHAPAFSCKRGCLDPEVREARKG
jgi:hypothetical protein